MASSTLAAAPSDGGKESRIVLCKYWPDNCPWVLVITRTTKNEPQAMVCRDIWHLHRQTKRSIWGFTDVERNDSYNNDWRRMLGEFESTNTSSYMNSLGELVRYQWIPVTTPEEPLVQ
jgi:hypothetical protein